MALQSNLYRRGAAYVWRRRLPARLGGKILQISLRTNEALLARRLAAIVSAESNRIFDAMIINALSRDDARKFLEQVIAREMQKIAVLHAEPSSRADVEDNRRHDWAMGHALKLLSQFGRAATPLPEAELAALQREGRSASEIALLRNTLARHANLPDASPETGQGATIRDRMKDALGREQISAAEFLVGRQLYIQGRGAAYLQAAQDDSLGFDAAMALAEQMAAFRSAAVPAAPAEQETDDDIAKAYPPGWPALIDRFCAQKQRQKVSAQTIDQMRKVFELFAEATGITDLRDIRQTHLARFVDLCKQLPRSYRKSSKDRDKSLRRILDEAKGLPPEKVGLSDTTVNRNLDYLGQIFTKAGSEGWATLRGIDTGSLRPRKNRRDRDAREALSDAEVQALFGHPVWQGSGTGKSWNRPGPNRADDGLFWLPMIAALSGARREEIAGLAPDDIAVLDGIPALRIRPNGNRGLKTLASTRDLPLHPQLVELGLPERARSMAEAGSALLFPDLRTPAAVKLGDKIDYKFRLILRDQLGEAASGKSFHSFRHYVATRLGRMGALPERLIKDILGHTGSDVTSERYTETSTLAAKLDAIRELPQLPVSGASEG